MLLYTERSHKASATAEAPISPSYSSQKGPYTPISLRTRPQLLLDELLFNLQNSIYDSSSQAFPKPSGVPHPKAFFGPSSILRICSAKQQLLESKECI